MLFTQDIGIDLGTSNTYVCVKGKGIVLREPSVVAVDVTGASKTVAAVGEAAKNMIGRTPGSIIAVQPVKNGVISDLTVTTEMLSSLIKRAMGKSIFNRARVMVCIPSGVTEVERKAVHMAARDAGARYVSLIEAPMAAAIGAGLPIDEPTGCMVVDIGGGSTDVAVLALGDIVSSKSVRVAGEHIDRAITAYMAKKYKLLVGERTAEDIKIKIGSAYPYEGEGALDVRGRNQSDGLPKNVEVSSAEVREAIAPTVQKIVDAIKQTLEKTPPELISDIIDRGIVLAGGTAHLRAIDKYIRIETKLPVTVADNPLECVVRGMQKCLDSDA